MAVEHPLRQGVGEDTIINPRTGQPWVIERHDSSREYVSELLTDTFDPKIPGEKRNPPRFHEARTVPGH